MAKIKITDYFAGQIKVRQEEINAISDNDAQAAAQKEHDIFASAVTRYAAFAGNAQIEDKAAEEVEKDADLMKRMEEATAIIEPAMSGLPKDKQDEIGVNFASAIFVGSLILKSDAKDKDKNDALKKIQAQLIVGLDKTKDKAVIDALIDNFEKVVPEPGKVATIGLDDVKTKVIARLTEAKMEPARITVFETGFDEMVGHLTDDQKKAIAVPENKINAIADAVFELNLKKDDAKTAVDKNEAALGVAGVAAMLKQGVTDAKIHDAALKTVKDEFAKKFPDQKDKDASGKLVNEAQKASDKYAAIPVKGVTFGKVASVGLGVGLVAWLVSAFKGKPVVDANGNPELDESGNQKRESAPFWKKALLGILTAATLCFAGKVAVQGKEVGTALGEMKNPMTWVARTAPSPTAAAIGR